MTSTKIMGITLNFHKIIGRDNLRALKPDLKSFVRFKNEVGIKETDKCVFFEDRGRRQCASPVWATLGAEPKLF